MRLTKQAIDGFTFEGKTPKSKDIRWDDELPGFGVRIWPSGAKTFVLFYRAGGHRQRLLGLGRYGVLTLQQARDLARIRLGEVLTGQDPMAEREKARRGEKVSDLCKAYLERIRKKSKRDDERMIRDTILARWGTRRIDAVTRADVARMHHELGKTKATTANRTLSLISAMWNKARLWGFLAENAPNPAAGVERFKEVKRDRFLDRDEVPALDKAIDEEPGIYVKALIWLYLLTGLRKNELLKLKWEHVNLRDGVLYLPDTKPGRPHYLPLSTPAQQILRAIPRLLNNEFVFCGKKAGAHLTEFRGPWDRIRKKAGIEDVRLHDLRRTVGSWMAQSGHSLALIGRVLNHSNTSTTQIYARFHLDPIADALEEHARLLEEAKQPRVIDHERSETS